jgi:nicotinamide riboside kinase
MRIGFIGVPGTRKTTTARALAGVIRDKIDSIKTVEYVDEYARKYLKTYGIDHLSDQVKIFKKQVALEDKFPESTGVIITDSPVFMGYSYALEMRLSGNKKHTMILNDLFKEMNKLNQVPRYDIIFHLPPVHQPVDDGIRAKHQFEQAWREEKDKQIVAVFHVFRPNLLHSVQSVSLEDRLEECISVIKSYTK